MPGAYPYVIFPGRHHVLTRFQADYLGAVVRGEALDEHGDPVDAAGAAVVFAMTSADHGNTRRNPIAAHRREAQIERFAAMGGLDVRTFPIGDVPPTPRFARHVLAAIAACDGGPALSPATAVVAVSTPAVAALWRELGFRILPVEARDDGSLAAERPWDVLEALVAARSLEAVADRLHPASSDVLGRYGLVDHLLRVHGDPLLSEDGELTETRDYNTYARSFDTDAARKWAEIRAHVRPGRIVDIGCGVGSLLREIGADPDFAESDLYGIEAARPLYEECVHRRSLGAFANPNTFFFQRTIGPRALFPPASVDTTLTVALTHELWSYLGEEALRAFLRATREQTVPGGVWIDLDVCGPEDGDRLVWLEPRGDQWLASWERFTGDWLPERATGELVERHGRRFVQTRLRWAMEWLSKKDYLDNWDSEMHEAFCFWSFSDRAREARAAGFELAPGSRGFTNPWLVEHRFAPAAALRPAGRADEILPWPDTHVLLVARRPARYD